jgi:hypothetical protein
MRKYVIKKSNPCVSKGNILLRNLPRLGHKSPIFAGTEPNIWLFSKSRYSGKEIRKGSIHLSRYSRHMSTISMLYVENRCHSPRFTISAKVSTMSENSPEIPLDMENSTTMVRNEIQYVEVIVWNRIRSSVRLCWNLHRLSCLKDFGNPFDLILFPSPRARVSENCKRRKYIKHM